MLFCWKPETMYVYCILCCFLSQFFFKSYVFFLLLSINRNHHAMYVYKDSLQSYSKHLQVK